MASSTFIPILVLLVFIDVISFASSQTGSCQPSGYLTGKSGQCNRDLGAECCQEGKRYPQYQCSPPVNASTPAKLTLNSFAEGGDGGGPSECDEGYHNDNEMVVALSTGWYAGGNRCNKSIRINANGQTAMAKVVDECDSVNGCDQEHNFQPPCHKNVVDASPAVWRTLGLDENQGIYDITRVISRLCVDY